MKTCNCTNRQAVIGGKCFTCGGEVLDQPDELTPISPELDQTADYLESLGPVAPEHRLPETKIVDDQVTMKCACDKVVKTLDMPRRNSGVCDFIDNICPGCEEQAKGLAPVICASCHRVCGRLVPETDQYGFKIEPGRVYHVEECAVCQPGKFREGKIKSPIIEMLLFHRKMGVQS